MSTIFKVLLVSFLILSSQTVGSTHTETSSGQNQSFREIYVYFESSAIGMTSEGCTIHVYLNTAIEVNAQNEIIGIRIYSSGLFKKCPEVHWAAARFSLEHDDQDVTAIIVEESCGDEELDSAIANEQTLEQVLEELNLAIDEEIANN